MLGLLLTLLAPARATSVIADAPSCAGWRERAPLAVVGHVVGFDAIEGGRGDAAWLVVAVDRALRGDVASGYLRVNSGYGGMVAVPGTRVYAVGALNLGGALVPSEGCREGIFGVLPDPETLPRDDASLARIARAEPRSTQVFDGAPAPTPPVLVALEASVRGTRARLEAPNGRVVEVLDASGVAPEAVAVRVAIGGLQLDDVVARASLAPVLVEPFHEGAITWQAGTPVDAADRLALPPGPLAPFVSADCPDPAFAVAEGVALGDEREGPCDTRVGAAWTPSPEAPPSGRQRVAQECSLAIRGAPEGATLATVRTCGLSDVKLRERGAPQNGWLPVRAASPYLAIEGWVRVDELQDGGIIGGVVGGVLGSMCVRIPEGAAVRVVGSDMVFARALRPADVRLIVRSAERAYVLVDRPSGPVVGEVDAAGLTMTACGWDGPRD